MSHSPGTTVSESHISILAEDTLPASQRKLVRPVVPGQLQRLQRREPSPLLAHQEGGAGTPQRSSHAEVFYFQKQMQAQTPMVFVLEDGERIEGIIEWYDAHSIKVRHVTRTLIYKASIKYLYKAGEAHP
jgi:sRNA-binding regulator protein Hfq